MPYWWSKERIEGTSGGIGGLIRHIKGLGRRFGTSKMHLIPPGGSGCCPF